MRTLLSVVSALALVLVLSEPASAQVGATFLLRSGERVSGDLVDLNARGLVATVNGAERAWPISEVAVVDFVSGGNNLPSGEVNQSGSRHLLVLRNGQILTGELTDIGGRNPLRITFDSGTGNRDYSSNEVARIYFARPTSGGTGGGSTQPPQPGRGTIQVSARDGWVSTGLQVGQGQTVYITSSGEVQLSADPNDVATTSGSKLGRHAPSSPRPQDSAGALIGRVGNGPPFGIGDQRSFPSPGTGILYLTVNDDVRSDNSGAFDVSVSLQPQSPTQNPNQPRRRRN